MKNIFTLLVVLVTTFGIKAQSIDAFFEKSDVFFKKNVKDNKVDYDGIKANPDQLNEALTIASNIDLSKESKFNIKAFWINAYNLSVIKGIVSKYPIKSALDIAGFFDKETYNLAKQTLTLNDVENIKLRKAFTDPYIHFALVCGANGCPPLISAAYMPESLNEQMHDQAGLALNNPNFIRLNTATKTVEISQIFEWYKEDFLADYKKQLDFINLFREVKIDDSYKVVFYNYDWTLNKK
jgi:Protein of unknown function, DUF547